MRPRVAAGLVVVLAVFALGGIYAVVAIESGASRLDELITLHQVEVLRESYLIRIKRVQSDLALRNTRYSRDFDTVVADVVTMGRAVDSCFNCHHSPVGEYRLRELKHETEKYEEALSRVLTLRANVSRLAEEEDNAFRRGEALMGKVKDIVAMTSAGLGEKTKQSLGRLRKANYILYAVLGIGSLLAAGVACAFLRGFGESARALREATEKIGGGDLDHRIPALKHDFGEVAASFNRMAGSLKDQVGAIQRTERMVILAELAAGLAREISGPLARIKAAIGDLARDPGLSAENRDVVRRAIEEIAWLEKVTSGSLDLAKPKTSADSDLNVIGALEATLAFSLRHRASVSAGPDHLRIVREFCPLPPTVADPVPLQQVFLNLFREALDAMPDGGVLGIRTSLDESPVAIRVEISDTGNGGVPRPKPSGLTLSVSRLLVERQGGTIGEVRIPGGGRVVTLRLPLKPPGDGAAP